MRFPIRILTFLFTSTVLTACGSFNNLLSEKTQHVEYYRIFDIKTQEKRKVIAEAASDGLGRNASDAQESTPIPSGPVPEEPGRFKLFTPFANTNFGALMAAGGGGNVRMATCDDAVWTAQAVRNIENSNTLNVTLCLFQYKEGYHLDMYARFSKSTGGLMQISRSLAAAAVGTPEEWTERTMLDVVRSIHKNVPAAEITLLEAEPEIKGTPWLAGFDR